MTAPRRTGKAAALTALRATLRAAPERDDGATITLRLTLALPSTPRKQAEYLLLVDDLHEVLVRLRAGGYLPDVSCVAHLQSAGGLGHAPRAGGT